jgi:ribosomal protein L11 methyltransferase
LKAYPALEIHAANMDRLFAAIDDLSPTAIEEREDSVRVFFSTTAARGEAESALAPHFDVSAVEVSDEDWARRSQENLKPVTVGRITVFPNPESQTPNPEPRIPNPVSIVILPSMGFGTGHHATTRLCLAALQTLDLADAFVLDVGTGSGVLAIAAERLGAACSLGIDHDADAVQSARENVGLNRVVREVTFAVDDLRTAALPPADVVTANLTGALLVAAAHSLLSAVRSGGTLIMSGLLSEERDEVVRALGAATVVWEREEDGWVGLAVKKPWQSTD